jgi:hypothetical protein
VVHSVRRDDAADPVVSEFVTDDIIRASETGRINVPAKIPTRDPNIGRWHPPAQSDDRGIAVRFRPRPIVRATLALASARFVPDGESGTRMAIPTGFRTRREPLHYHIVKCRRCTVMAMRAKGFRCSVGLLKCLIPSISPLTCAAVSGSSCERIDA